MCTTLILLARYKENAWVIFAWLQHDITPCSYWCCLIDPTLLGSVLFLQSPGCFCFRYIIPKYFDRLESMIVMECFTLTMLQFTLLSSQANWLHTQEIVRCHLQSRPMSVNSSPLYKLHHATCRFSCHVRAYFQWHTSSLKGWRVGYYSTWKWKGNIFEP